MLKIRPSTKLDLDEIMCILGEARETIGRLGIDQWQYGYPSRAIIKEDMTLGRSYVVEERYPVSRYGFERSFEGSYGTY